MHKNILLKKKIISQFTIVFVVTAVFAFLNSCTKTITETVIEEPSWKSDSYFLYNDKIILNSYATQDELFVLAFSLFTIFDYTSENPVYSRLESLTSSMNYKPIISDQITAFSNDPQTAIVFKLNGRFQPTGEYIYLSQIDSIFVNNGKLGANFYTEPIGAFSNNNQFLTMFMDNDHNPYFALIDYIFDDNTYSGIQVTSAQSILIEDWILLCIEDIESFGNRFFVATHGMGDSKPNFLVYPSGYYEEIDIRYYGVEFFSYRDIVYLLISDNNLYCSHDLGENWELVGTFYPAHLSPRFFEINGKLCVYIYSQIWEFDIDNAEVRELDNWGLEGNEITSINEFNDKVYITTLSGLFYRDVEEFFTYKEDNGKEKGKLTFEKI
ncbi:MAG: hypothetical protein ISS28_03485 [Candidatus Cloacimonetes bacterium]|nr:hypothetical protein [Candidatus Cloacimonadota bacterium]MBL7086154.1 hypothetical protein [Candidatus Cloacimonadota bacterium]